MSLVLKWKMSSIETQLSTLGHLLKLSLLLLSMLPSTLAQAGASPAHSQESSDKSLLEMLPLAQPAVFQPMGWIVPTARFAQVKILLDWNADQTEVSSLLRKITSVKALPDMANSWKLMASELSDLLSRYNRTLLLLSHDEKRRKRDLSGLLALGTSAWALKRTFDLGSRLSEVEDQEGLLLQTLNSSLHTDQAIKQDLKYIHKAVRDNSLSTAQVELYLEIEQSLRRVVARAHARLTAARSLVLSQLSAELVPDAELREAFALLQPRLHNAGLLSIWEDHRVLYRQSVSWYVTSSHVTVVVPVAVTCKEAWPPYRLSRSVAVPRLTPDGLKAFQTTHMIATRSSDSSFLVISTNELSSCRKTADLWICSTPFPQWKSNRTDCITALYTGMWTDLPALCPSPRPVRSPWLLPINNTWILAAHTAPTRYTVVCPGRADSVVLEGVRIVKIKSGCKLEGPEVTVLSTTTRRLQVDIHVPPLLTEEHEELLEQLFNKDLNDQLPYLPALSAVEQRLNQTERLLKAAVARHNKPMNQDWFLITIAAIAALALALVITFALTSASWAKPFRRLARSILSTCLRPLLCCLEALSIRTENLRARVAERPPPPRRRQQPPMRMGELQQRQQQRRSQSPVNTSEDSDPTGTRGPRPMPLLREPAPRNSRREPHNSTSSATLRPQEASQMKKSLISTASSTPASLPSLTTSGTSTPGSSRAPDDVLLTLDQAAKLLEQLNTNIQARSMVMQAQTQQMRRYRLLKQSAQQKHLAGALHYYSVPHPFLEEHPEEKLLRQKESEEQPIPHPFGLDKSPNMEEEKQPEERSTQESTTPTPSPTQMQPEAPLTGANLTPLGSRKPLPGKDLKRPVILLPKEVIESAKKPEAF